jgi:hypothetical protein
MSDKPKLTLFEKEPEAFFKDLKTLFSLSEEKFYKMFALFDQMQDASTDVRLISEEFASDLNIDRDKLYDNLSISFYLFGLIIAKNYTQQGILEDLSKLFNSDEMEKIKKFIEYGASNLQSIRKLVISTKEMDILLPKLENFVLALDYRVGSKELKATPDLLFPYVIVSMSTKYRGKEESFTMQMSLPRFRDVMRTFQHFYEHSSKVKARFAHET